MRISVRKDDRGYYKYAHKFTPYLNGVEAKDCHTIDEEGDYIIKYLCDVKGKFIVLNGTIASAKIYGMVEIKRCK